MTKLRVYQDALLLVRLMRALWERAGRHSKRIRTQMENAATSAAANIAEGAHRSGGHQRERFGVAMGSARECIAHCEIAIEAGYITRAECEEAIDLADKIAATLWRCLHPR
jgi:four helix bundle protein